MRKYADEVPDFLHGRPKLFVQHCMERLNKIVTDEIQCLSNGTEYKVGQYIVNLSLPECECMDFIRTGWPCKHMLALLNLHGLWTSLPEAYRQMPCFVIDDQQETAADHTSKEDMDENSSDHVVSVRAHGLELLDELRSSFYLIEDEDLLSRANTELGNIANYMRQSVLTLDKLTSKKSKKKKLIRKQTEPHTIHEDEKDKGIIGSLHLQNIL